MYAIFSRRNWVIGEIDTLLLTEERQESLHLMQEKTAVYDLGLKKCPDYSKNFSIATAAPSSSTLGAIH